LKQFKGSRVQAARTKYSHEKKETLKEEKKKAQLQNP
jgi:hypothetical protein